jgi:hypothetical protein
VASAGQPPPGLLFVLIVIYFFFYPFIVSSTIKLFACVTVDDSGAGDAGYSRFAILQSGTFLLIDTTQECYAPGSWHAAATYAIAIPSLVVLVFGVHGSTGRTVQTTDGPRS